MLLHNSLILITASEYAAMYFWVQSLNPPVHHLWKTGVLRDFHSGDIFCRKQLVGAPGREYFNIQFMKCFREGNNASLVGYANQRTTNGSRIFCCHSAIFIYWAFWVDAKPAD